MVFQPSTLPPDGADTATCRRCHNLIWVAGSILPAVFQAGPSWRDKYGNICKGSGHSPEPAK
ncbi:hypothetical protein LCGC14_0532260 [marine sediment metagenome]|uniref:Uncharacterized protein n=1 Tax=marine sediment metagenome TaxID=412755 RepID=A0A0F9SDM7_9ZZZZ